MLAQNLGEHDALVVKGTGNVGGALLQTVEDLGLSHKVMGLVASTGGIIKLDDNDIAAFAAGGEERAKLLEGDGAVDSLDDLCVALRDKLGLDPIVVDVSNDSTIGNYPVLLDNGFRVATANKYESSEAEAEDAIRLMQDPKYGYDPTVMAGQGAVLKLQMEREFISDIFSVEGSFSGTCSYLTKEMQADTPFSEALCKAMELGYTEPDPNDDADGKDVAKKLVILARTLGFEVGLEDVEVEGLLGTEFRDIYNEVKSEVESGFDMTSLSEDDKIEIKKGIRERFTQKVKENGVDDYYVGEVLKNKDKGLVPRYIASMKIEGGKPKMKVSLQFVEPTSELGSASSNKLVIGINRHIDPDDEDKNEVDFSGVLGAGAGPYTTAKGVITQVSRVAARTKGIIR